MKLIIFTAHGGAQLLASGRKNAAVLWSSDDDQDFAQEFDNDIIDPDSQEDLDALVDWLIELEFLEEDEEFETDTQYLDKDDDVCYTGDDEEGEDDE